MQESADMNRKLYVGNLPDDATESDVQALFATAGAVTSVQMMRERDTGRGRGFAFVEMATDADAVNAMSILNESPFGGRNLSVNEARPRPASNSFGRPRGNRRF
jgi:cold-inducible RNA-binding protein